MVGGERLLVHLRCGTREPRPGLGYPPAKAGERSWRMEETVRRRTALRRDGQDARPYQR